MAFVALHAVCAQFMLARKRLGGTCVGDGSVDVRSKRAIGGDMQHDHFFCPRWEVGAQGGPWMLNIRGRVQLACLSCGIVVSPPVLPAHRVSPLLLHAGGLVHRDTAPNAIEPGGRSLGLLRLVLFPL